MREILFRGKTYSGEWVQGDLFEVFDDGFFIHDKRCHSVKIIPSTIGQYTGLTDKYGKKIFEGDIVKFCTELKEICFVDYGKGKYILRQLKKDKHLSWQSIDIFELFDLECEVISNIHDNPELLKGAEQ